MVMSGITPRVWFRRSRPAPGLAMIRRRRTGIAIPRPGNIESSGAPNLMGNTPATALFVLAPGEIVSRSTEMVLGAEMQGRWHVGCGHLKTAGGKR